MIRALARLLTVTILSTLLAACANKPQPQTAYIFSSFRDNGESGLHLAYSRDGYRWQPLNQDKPLLKSTIGQGLMRDPCIILGPDGRYHMVWTTGWWDKGIGIAHSDNLIDWSEPEFVPVMAHEPTARNSWAPEIIWDDEREQYVIYWASTIPGRFPATEDTGDDGLNHRIYYTATKDFKNYSETQLFYQPDFNVIDSTIVKDGDDYVMVLKDETRHPPAKYLQVTRSNSLYGPWQTPLEPFTPKDLWVEGPTILRLPDSWLVYYDEYTSKAFGAMKTQDFIHWEDVSEQIHMPEGSRHGTVLQLPLSELEALLWSETG
ncbi:glycoside hydrolase family 43 protein [Gilvimarinus xylanilyticus]|uniref:Glycoside hydrolase family 43 protein n=1 Tax=Gilvimarinus xylanilyticus TaxID=2944139 RepID=A0A9X2HUH7_9GAMM|nr:glycoside hydrolase family 43 protein [Gilvimarinus xylanilyticus]MCP8898465.1 glycoside hydrolase family 43 protein [Gilvimarinus xylanilyticus]